MNDLLPKRHICCTADRFRYRVIFDIRDRLDMTSRLGLIRYTSHRPR